MRWLLLAFLVGITSLALWNLTKGGFAAAQPGPAGLRWLGGLFGLGLALSGAVLLVVGLEGSLGASLAILSSGLAGLAVWGGDLLWSAKARLGFVISLTCIVGGLAVYALALPFTALTLVALMGAFAAQAAGLIEDRRARGRLVWLRQHLRAWMVLLALSALIRIPVPLWPEGFPLVSLLQVSLICLAAILWAWDRVGPRILPIAAIAFGIGLGIELLGSQTGFPFGLYSYQTSPPPTLWGVPLIVPLGWFGLVLAAHVLAGGRPWLTGLLVVAWDLGLEALMPFKGYWVWSDPHPLWYGAPLQNYLSWFAVGALISWVYLRLGPELHRSTGLAWAYRLEALFVPVGLALFGLWPAALVCGVAMNVLAWWGIRSLLAPQAAGREVSP